MANTTDIRAIIALRLYKAREMSGLSQKQVAKILGISRSSVTQIESGNRKVSAEEIAKFADIYQVDVSWLLGKCEYQADLSEIQLSEEETKKLMNKLKPKDLDTLSVIIASIRGEKK